MPFTAVGVVEGPADLCELSTFAVFVSVNLQTAEKFRALENQVGKPMNTDPISDMLTRIRNAQAVKKAELVLPYSNMKFGIAKILEKEGFVEQVSQITEAKFPNIQIRLKYTNGVPAITSIQRISRPGRRVYTKSEDLKNVLSGLGCSVVSTPNGLMTNKEAHARHLGGEVICEVF